MLHDEAHIRSSTFSNKGTAFFKYVSKYGIGAVFLSLSFAFLLSKFFPLSIALSAVIGLLFSFAYGSRGFIASVAIFVPMVALSSKRGDLFSWVFAASSICSWWLASLSRQEVCNRMGLWQEKEKALSDRQQDLEFKLKESEIFAREIKKEKEKKIHQFEQQIEEYNIQVTSHRHHLALAWQEASHLKEEQEKQRKQFQSQIDFYKRQIETQMNEKRELESAFQKLNESLEESKQRSSALSDEVMALQNTIQQEKDNAEKNLCEVKEKQQALIEELKAKLALDQECQNAQEVMEDEAVLPWESLYKQLRLQFDEKSEVLNQTRKELFHTENQLLALEKEKEVVTFDEDVDQKILVSQMKALEEEREDLEDQVLLLQEIISSMQEKKKMMKPRKPRKSKKDSSQPLPLDEIIESKILEKENQFSL